MQDERPAQNWKMRLEGLKLPPMRVPCGRYHLHLDGGASVIEDGWFKFEGEAVDLTRCQPLSGDEVDAATSKPEPFLHSRHRRRRTDASHAAKLTQR